MILLFQIVFTLFAAYALAGVMKKKGDAVLGPKGVIFWLGFWVAALIMVWWPESASKLATIFGIGRGTDFIIYVSIALIFLILFRLHVKLESMSRDITAVVRKDAVDE